MLWLNEDESFSLTANVETPGEVRMVLQGYLVSKRGGETWVAPLIPQLFYGASGLQLQTWRQDITTAGSQVILSRSGGQPSVPREELAWRRLTTPEEKTVTAQKALAAPSPWPTIIFALGLIGVAGIAAYYIFKK